MSLALEKRTISALIRLFCKKNHGSTALCSDCEEILHYAFKKIELCLYGEEKPACNKCTIHCYTKEMQEKIREVMRYAGPKMPVRHPFLTLLHFTK